MDRKVVPCPSFCVMLNPTDPMVWINYAVPTGEASAADIAAMVEAFRAHDRVPRLEFFRDLWPSVAMGLEEAGFSCLAEMPIMILQAADFSDRPSAISCSEVGPDEVDVLSAVTGAAFAETDHLEAPSAESVALGSAAVAGGRWIAMLATIDSEVAGGGVAVGNRKSREAAGIGTLPRFRRQGVASAVLDALGKRHFGEGGELMWLTPGDVAAQSVYERAGYRTVGTQVCYQLG